MESPVFRISQIWEVSFLNCFCMQFQAKRHNNFKNCIEIRVSFSRKCFIKAFAGQASISRYL